MLKIFKFIALSIIVIIFIILIFTLVEIWQNPEDWFFWHKHPSELTDLDWLLLAIWATFSMAMGWY